MLNPDIFIRELELLIDQQVEHVLMLAAGWPESRGAWDRLLERYHVSPNEPRDHPSFQAGAPVTEVRRVLAAIRQMASPALAHIEVQFGEEIAGRLPLAARVSRLRARVYSLEELADASQTSAPTGQRSIWGRPARGIAAR